MEYEEFEKRKKELIISITELSLRRGLAYDPKIGDKGHYYVAAKKEEQKAINKLKRLNRQFIKQNQTQLPLELDHSAV